MFPLVPQFWILDRYTEEEAFAIADRIVYNQMLKDWEVLDEQENGIKVHQQSDFQ